MVYTILQSMHERKTQKLYTDRLTLVEILKICAILALTFLIARAAYSMTKNAFAASQSQKEYTKKLQSLDDQKNFLQKTLSLMNTPEGKESYIRKELRVVKPGERMFVVQE